MTIQFPIELVTYPVPTGAKYVLVGRDHAEICVCLEKENAETIKFALEQLPQVPGKFCEGPHGYDQLIQPRDGYNDNALRPY